jgi:PBSX family phage terminase large subunit
MDLVETLPLNYGDRIREFALRDISEDKRINILDGSVRSGKTWALHPKILWASSTATGIRGWRVLFGQTYDSIYSNVLKDLFDLIGDRYYSFSRHSGHLRIFDTEWRILSARDEGSEKFLRGNTVGIAVGDELVLTPEGFFKMMLTRMSPKGARLYATTNPDNPMHWLNQDYLLNQRVDADLHHLHMTMDDNPNLDPGFVEAQKRLYKGMFYKRFIQGLWVMAEGSIWSDAWDDDLLYCDFDCVENHAHTYVPITLKNAGGFTDHWFSNDYGTDHPHVYHEFWDDGETVWLDREWVWDSKERLRQLTDGQYADKLIEFMGPYAGAQVIIPPDALSFRQECTNRGMWVTVAKNEVMEGIQTVAGMMAARRLRINCKCMRTRRGIVSYVWDPNAAKRGKEEPLQKNDDEACSLRYGLHAKIPKWRYAVQTKVAA